VVAHLARDRAIAEGQAEVDVAAAVLTVTTDPPAVQRAIDAARRGNPDRI